MSTAVLDRPTRDAADVRRPEWYIPTSEELREMTDEQVLSGYRHCRANETDWRIQEGYEMPTREQNPYLGDNFRRNYKRLGRQVMQWAEESGTLRGTRRADAAKVAQAYPGFPADKLPLLQEILDILTDNAQGDSDYAEHIMTARRRSRDHLRDIAEGRIDDVYRKLWWKRCLR